MLKMSLFTFKIYKTVSNWFEKVLVSAGASFWQERLVNFGAHGCRRFAHTGVTDYGFYQVTWRAVKIPTSHGELVIT